MNQKTCKSPHSPREKSSVRGGASVFLQVGALLRGRHGYLREEQTAVRAFPFWQANALKEAGTTSSGLLPSFFWWGGFFLLR